MTNPFPKCDRCDKLAIHSCIDVFRYDNYLTGFVEFYPTGLHPHYGCEDHPVLSIEFITMTPPPARGKAKDS